MLRLEVYRPSDAVCSSTLSVEPPMLDYTLLFFVKEETHAPEPLSQAASELALAKNIAKKVDLECSPHKEMVTGWRC